VGDSQDLCDWNVYTLAVELDMQVCELSKDFPKYEWFSLTDQIRRSSRSICANIAEAWRERRDPNAFDSKLQDAIDEVPETQLWLYVAVKWGCLASATGGELQAAYENVWNDLCYMLRD
jgi:four helix bundle protein